MSDIFNEQLTPHAAATSLPNPPVSWSDVRSWAAARDFAFDYEVWADAATVLAGLELLGGIRKPIVIADDNVDSVSSGADTITLTGHAYKNGDGPVRLTTTGTLPGGLLLATDYWVQVVDANTIKLHSSLDSWLAMSSATDITSAGSGTHTIADIVGVTERMHWLSHGLLGRLGDGAVTADAQGGYSSRLAHRPRVIAYAFAASSVSAAVTIQISLARASR